MFYNILHFLQFSYILKLYRQFQKISNFYEAANFLKKKNKTRKLLTSKKIALPAFCSSSANQWTGFCMIWNGVVLVSLLLTLNIFHTLFLLLTLNIFHTLFLLLTLNIFHTLFLLLTFNI